MIEIAMAICLTIMGIYFFKSTDLPKELKERSAQMKAESANMSSTLVAPRKMDYSKSISTQIKNANQFNQSKLEEMHLRKKAAELKIHNDAIDQLTLTITTLEQEIRINNEKNSEIQSLIDSHLISLQMLQEKVISLS
jgi:3-deoxy-D-manno-octulosonic-acid transferase